MPYGRLAKVKGLPDGIRIGQATIFATDSVLDCKAVSLRSPS